MARTLARSLGALVVGAVTLSACSSCETSQLGRLAARELGDVSNPRAERIRFDRDLRQACGDAAAPAGFLRQPYVQDVTPTGAAVVWVSVAKAPEMVVVTDAGGRQVATATAQVDRAEVPRGSQKTARLRGLAPGAIHCYQLRGAGGALTARIGFRTAPDADQARFAAMSDIGLRTSDQAAVFEQLQTVAIDFAVLGGDIAYESGALDELELNVFSVYAPMMQSVPFFPALGNHDVRTQGGLPLLQSFALPTTGGDVAAERWYSFDWGPVHVVALDTEHEIASQARWLDGDLGATDRRWKVVVMHRPPYSSGHHGADIPVRDELAPVFERHRVALVLTGHEHHYERTVPIRGVVYVITGGGGRGTRPVGRSSFTAFSQQVAHFVYVTATDDTLRLHAIDARGGEFDSLVLTAAGR